MSIYKKYGTKIASTIKPLNFPRNIFQFQFVNLKTGMDPKRISTDSSWQIGTSDSPCHICTIIIKLWRHHAWPVFGQNVFRGRDITWAGLVSRRFLAFGRSNSGAKQRETSKLKNIFSIKAEKCILLLFNFMLMNIRQVYSRSGLNGCISSCH